MNLRITFRLLLLASILFPLTSAALYVLGLEALPDQLADYRSAVGDADPLEFEMAAGLGLLVLVVIILPINMIGLWFFKKWARTLYALITVLAFLSMPFMGPVVMGPWESTFYDVSSFLWGVLIALMFASTISNEFSGASAHES